MSSNHLIIGLGGTGGKIIRAFRKMIYQEFRSVDPDGINIEYLYVDSDKGMMDANDATWKVLGESVQLEKASQLVITGADLKSRLDNINTYPGIKDWIGSKEDWNSILNSILGETLGSQKRRLGRFLFACKSKEFQEMLLSRVRQLQRSGGDTPVTFHICAGLAGGTGSGSIVDVIAQTRAAHNDDPRSYPILVYALMPDRVPKPKWDTGNYHANGYAALLELNALSVGALRPHDVTGNNGSGEAARMKLKDPFNGCYLFTNENENQRIVDVETEVPDILANFLYQKIVVVNRVPKKTTGKPTQTDKIIWESLRKAENAENGDGTPELAPGSNIPERSKRFLTFGIKRLAIPEEEIREYLTYSFARQAALQLQYNNWDDERSFADTPRNQSFSEVVKKKEQLQKWMMSDDHLRLSIGILPDEAKNKQWKPIGEYWQEIVPRFQQSIRDDQKDRKIWLEELTNLCTRQYEQDYRGLGVVRFYQTKENDRRDHLREIRACVERGLVEDWRTGTQSMQDIRRLLEALIQSTEERLGTMEGKIADFTQRESETVEKINANVKTWGHLGVISVHVFGKADRLFQVQGILLQELYTYRTNIHAWNFAKNFTKALIGELQSLLNEVDKCVSVIGDATKTFGDAINARLNDDGQEDMQQQLIKFYKPDAVRDFTRTLIRSRDEQEKQTKIVRDALLGQLGTNPSFALFNQRITKEQFVNTLEQQCQENALRAHDAFVMQSESKKRVLGDSIVEKLHSEYGGDTQPLRAYIQQLVAMAGNYVNFNRGEEDKVGPGIPESQKAREKVSSFTVILPEFDGLPDFSNALHEDFENSRAGSSTEFIPSKAIPCEVKPNEITLINITNLFPLRYLEQTQFLHQKYQARMGGPGQERARLELHSEGDGSQYPLLYVPSVQEALDQGLPYILIARACEIIRLIKDDTTGKSSLYLIPTDDRGREGRPERIGTRLLECLQTLDLVQINRTTHEVMKKLQQEFTHTGAQEELAQSVAAIVTEIKGELKNNTLDEKYQRFYEAGNKAEDIIRREV